MPDALTPYQPPDPGRIDSLDNAGLQYWCKELACTEAKLTEAISKVGEHVTAVREHLAARR
ncbi:MAG: DUF3606 domain-containing protein [Ramlibacter sp.]|nr:DUF3606 domain-containing protein [Ramlibacter sp.]